MLNFLFWNINKKPLTASLGALINKHQIDLLLLAECTIAPRTILQEINKVTSKYSFAFGAYNSIAIYLGFSRSFLRPIIEGPRYTIRHLILPGRKQLLVACAHLPSGLYFSKESHPYECVELIRDVEAAENKVGHSNTLLMGDFNMNPFDSGMVAAGGLHAVSTRSTAMKGSRTIQTKQYKYFYNPMWAHFGDKKGSPSGTYYYDRAEYLNYFWNIFDQVLLRPSLIPHFDPNGLQIVDNDGINSLTSASGIPEKKTYSDHLPIVFGLNI
jgi:exonuclease III